MRVLISGAASRLGVAVAAELASDHTIQEFDGSLLSKEDCDRAVQGIDAVVLTAEPPASLPDDPLARDQMILDLATRGTDTLVRAAVEAGVKRFVYAGTLSIFRDTPNDLYISEMWKPKPSPDMRTMANFLGELVVCEFARENFITATSLRLGDLVAEEEVEGESQNLLWLDYRDAAQAIRCALQRDHSGNISWQRRWEIVHICADIPNAKFLIDKAKKIGFDPQHNFKSHHVGQGG